MREEEKSRCCWRSSRSDRPASFLSSYYTYSDRYRYLFIVIIVSSSSNKESLERERTSIFENEMSWITRRQKRKQERTFFHPHRADFHRRRWSRRRSSFGDILRDRWWWSNRVKRRSEHDDDDDVCCVVFYVVLGKNVCWSLFCVCVCGLFFTFWQFGVKKNGFFVKIQPLKITLFQTHFSLNSLSLSSFGQFVCFLSLGGKFKKTEKEENFLSELSLSLSASYQQQHTTSSSSSSSSSS